MTEPAVFDSPEEAAVVGFAPKYCHVVASRVHGDHACVLIETGSDGNSYLYGVNCVRGDGGWRETSSGSGGGWSMTGPGDLGMLAFWGEAPPHADTVRVMFGGAACEEAVNEGAFLAVWWETPQPAIEDWPRIEAFRIHGEWEPPAWFECL